MSPVVCLTEELSLYLDPSFLRDICASQEKLGAFHVRFFALLKEIKREMQPIYIDDPSDDLIRRHVNDLQVYLSCLLNTLMDQVPCARRKQFIRNKRKAGRELQLSELMQAIDGLLKSIYYRYPRYFDADGQLPVYSRLKWLQGERLRLNALKRKLRRGVKDTFLVGVIEDYITSFSYFEDCLFYSFSDSLRFFCIMEHLGRELRYATKGDRTAEVRRVLSRGGFNNPSFASYCINYYFCTYLKDLPDSAAERSKISQLRCIITAMGGTAFRSRAYAPLHEQLGAWLDKEAVEYFGSSRAAHSAQSAVFQAEGDRTTVNVSVKELAMFVNAVSETGLLAGSKQHIASEICKGLCTVRTPQIALHSFYNSLNNHDWKAASRLVVDLERIIGWLNENTEIKEYKN